MCSFDFLRNHPAHLQEIKTQRMTVQGLTAEVGLQNNS